jgi:hypothetical protein
MNEITVSLNSDLRFNENKISINRNSSSDNAFEIKSDGIYVSKSGGGTMDGFIDKDYGMFRIGYGSGYVTATTPPSFDQPGRVSAHNCVHKTFTMKENSYVPAYREEIDCYKPGDFVRIPRGNNQYEYFIITATTLGSEDNARLGNSISLMASLGTW